MISWLFGKCGSKIGQLGHGERCSEELGAFFADRQFSELHRNLAPPYEEKRKHWRFEVRHTTVVYERSALNQGIVLPRASPAKLEWPVNSEGQDLARLNIDSCEAIRWSVNRSHAVDPCIHVASIEIRKSKLALKGVVKARPVRKPFNRNRNRWRHVQ